MQRSNNAMRREASRRSARGFVALQGAREARKVAPCHGDIIVDCVASDKAFSIDVIKLEPRELALVVARRNVEYAVERVQRAYSK